MWRRSILLKFRVLSYECQHELVEAIKVEQESAAWNARYQASHLALTKKKWIIAYLDRGNHNANARARKNEYLELCRLS